MLSGASGIDDREGDQRRLQARHKSHFGMYILWVHLGHRWGKDMEESSAISDWTCDHSKENLLVTKTLLSQSGRMLWSLGRGL